MALYEMTTSAFRPIDETSFADIHVGERTDIQRLLRTQIDVLDDELYVLTEELATGRTASGVPNAIDDRRRFMR